MNYSILSINLLEQRMNLDHNQLTKAGEILIVDDNPDNLKFLMDLLTQAGYRVRPASDGELALRSVKAKLPVLILLDIRMPNMDGFEVCRRLKADVATRDIPIIFASALNDSAEKVKSFELGGVDYIVKPLNAQEVLMRIANHLSLYVTQQHLEIQNSQLKEAAIELNQQRDNLENLVRELSIAKEAADAANIAKSTFIATMSHELRTPLNAILGFSELLSLDESLTAKQKETLAIINRSGAHLLSMINDVLDISKIEAGRLILDIQAFDLIDLLHDIGEMISVRAATKKLEFVLDIAPNIARFIKADSGKLRQVLINLLGNAIKFTHQGKVILRADTQSVASVITTVLTIEVIDTGIGIPEQELADLFHPFVQLVQKKSDTEGTGLGLAISESLINLMGGHISVSSVFGEGSIFKIELPIVLASASDIIEHKVFQRVVGLAPDQPTCRLLVVDDNADNRLLLVTLLTNMGFQVREAENGEQAIRLFEQWQPALCWMDMRMPNTDGYAATTKIRQLKGGDKVKIIALTASAFKEQHTHIINAGCDAVLHKPFHIPDICATLTKYLGVNFEYQETTTPVALATGEISIEMFSKLSPIVRQQLHEAALNLDTEETARIIALIHNTLPDIADYLQTLAQTYQFEQLIQLTTPANNANIT